MPRKRRTGDEATILFRRTARGLEPLGPWDEELLDRFPIGVEVEASPRAVKQDPERRKFFAICNRVAKATGDYPNGEALARAIKIKLRMVDSVQLIGGGFHVIPKSTADMDQVEFRMLFEGAIEIIATEIMPGCDVDELLEPPDEWKRRNGRYVESDAR